MPHYRWVKFEEDVEEAGRWGKPHVATLSLHSVFELRSLMMHGTVILDMDCSSLDDIIEDLLHNLEGADDVSLEQMHEVKMWIGVET